LQFFIFKGGENMIKEGKKEWIKISTNLIICGIDSSSCIILHDKVKRELIDFLIWGNKEIDKIDKKLEQLGYIYDSKKLLATNKKIMYLQWIEVREKTPFILAIEFPSRKIILKECPLYSNIVEKVVGDKSDEIWYLWYKVYIPKSFKKEIEKEVSKNV